MTVDRCDCVFGFDAMTNSELDANANARMADLSEDELAHLYEVYHDRGRLNVLFDNDHPVDFYGVPDLKNVQLPEPARLS